MSLPCSISTTLLVLLIGWFKNRDSQTMGLARILELYSCYEFSPKERSSAVMRKMLISVLICAATSIGASAHPGHGNHNGHGNNSYGHGHTKGHGSYNSHKCGYNCSSHYNGRIKIRTSQYSNYGYGNTGYYSVVNYKPKPVYGYGTIAPVGFNQLKYAVMSANFDHTRLQIAKQGIAANYTTSAQVLELMQCLDFESNRLKLAKFAYPYTVDQQNYFIVNNGFDFNSSVSSLYNYISRY